MRKLLPLLLSLCSLFSCNSAEHFISDGSYRKNVHKTLEQRLSQAQLSHFYNPGPDVSVPEREALEFLYAYMPVADLTDYPTSFYLDNVRKTFQAKAELPWGKDVPELFFRHFVLPLRTNNEPLDSARLVFYDELKPIVENLSMKDAILEVNHWCHSKVTYQPSDARTSAPLATVMTTLGRCGEESTFTVAALRSVGIPARQVYTPRWAHTESNHAWVEAWADGQWWFLGACEPEAVLNLGWFNAPASRAMLTHTKVFGEYWGEEEVVLRSPNYTEINLIGNYAKTGRVDFRIEDTAGAPVEGARVDFCIYNSSSFYPAVTKYSGKNGDTFLSAGLGDLLVWASKDGHYGFRKVTFGADSNVTIVLDDPVGSPIDATLMHIVPPVEDVLLPTLTPEMRAENDRRMKEEDAVRKAYMATFFSPESAAAYVKEKSLPEAAAQLLVGSSGNHRVIASFLEQAEDKERAVSLLRSLSAKDLHDVTSEVLWDSYNAKESILSPRIESEFLTPYKGYFLQNIPADLQKAFAGGGDPTKGVPAILAWIKDNITVDDNPLFWSIPISPRGVWEGRLTDAHSRNLFFIALCRTFGFEARQDRVSGKMQYNAIKRDPSAPSAAGPFGGGMGRGGAFGAPSGDWRSVDFEAASEVAARPMGRVLLTSTPVEGEENPSFGRNYTVSKIENGTLRGVFVGMGDGPARRQRGPLGPPRGGNAPRDNIAPGTELEEGDYLMCSGNRLSDGSTPVTVTLFHVTAGQTIQVPVRIETIPETLSVEGNFDGKTLIYPTTDKIGEGATVRSKVGDGPYALAVLSVGLEPTNHVLHDIAEEKTSLEGCAIPIVLLTRSEAEMARLQTEISAGRYGNLPSTVVFGIDKGEVLSQATKNLKVSEERLPIVLVMNNKEEVVFKSQGYTIGMGAKILAVAKKLQEGSAQQ